VTDWKARAEREAVAVLDGTRGGLLPQSRESLISMLALAWLQGASFGMHDAANTVNGTFEEMRAEL
jgi:hypothetical protein